MPAPLDKPEESAPVGDGTPQAPPVEKPAAVAVVTTPAMPDKGKVEVESEVKIDQTPKPQPEEEGDGEDNEDETNEDNEDEEDKPKWAAKLEQKMDRLERIMQGEITRSNKLQTKKSHPPKEKKKRRRITLF